MADEVHTFQGVRYVPIKVIRDPAKKRVCAGGLSKQMGYIQQVPEELAWGPQ